jgi:hypothetical protein
LPLTILFFVFFVVSAFQHEAVMNSSMLQRQFRAMLSGTTFEGVQFTSGHKDLSDIDTKEDIYTYLQDVIVSLFIPSKDTAVSERNRVLRYNQLIGGIQIQQVRRNRQDCAERYESQGSLKKILSNFKCYPWDTESEECMEVQNWPADRSGWCPDSQIYRPRRLDYVPDGGGKGGSTKGYREDPTPNQTYSIYLYEHEGTDAALTTLRLMQDNGWIDYSTAWVGINMLVLNPDLQVFLYVTVHVYFPPGGSLLPHITSASFQPDSNTVLPTDIVWCVLLGCLALVRIIHLVQDAKAGRLRETLKSDGWIILDICVILGGVLCIILWLVLNSVTEPGKNKAMMVRLEEPQAAADAFTNYRQLVADLHGEMVTISNYIEVWRMVLCFYTLLISVKFMESFSAQPRLAVVTATVGRAWSDLFHFIIVVGTIFMAFTISGMFLFGRRMFEFSNLPEACMTCFRILLGDFDWDAMSEEHPGSAAVWFFANMLLLNLLMLNMLMAIIMDTYTEVKSDASSSKMVWEQCYEMVGDGIAWLQGRLVSTNTILEALEKTEVEDLDEDELIKVVGPKLSKEQAEELIKATYERENDEINKGFSISHAMKMIGWVKVAVQKIGWQLEFIAMEEKSDIKKITEDEESTESEGGGAESECSQSADYQFTDSGGLLDMLETRMAKMEEYMHNAEHFLARRGADAKNRLVLIEELVRNERDACSSRIDNEHDLNPRVRRSSAM